MAERRANRRVRPCGGPVGREHVGRVLRGLPRAWALREDLDGVGAELDAPLEAVDECAAAADVGADEHDRRLPVARARPLGPQTAALPDCRGGRGR